MFGFEPCPAIDYDHPEKWTQDEQRLVNEVNRLAEETASIHRDAILKDAEFKQASWRDGHSQYEEIPNPIVRLRFNERTTHDAFPVSPVAAEASSHTDHESS